MAKQYRLIWFQHFHKAAGTSIISIAKQNGEKLYGNNINGNPQNQHGKEIKLWDYSPSQIKWFIDECEEQGVTFVATEWGLPDLSTLKSDPRVVLISCLREPLARFVSNFYFDLYNGFTKARDLASYIDSRNRTITMHNYYCRILSKQNNQPSEIKDKHFDIAKAAIGKFDFVFNIQDGLVSLSNYLDWHISNEVRANRTSLSAKQFLSLVLKARWKLLYLRLRYPKRAVDNAFIDHYKKENKWDYKLFKTINSDLH